MTKLSADGRRHPPVEDQTTPAGPAGPAGPVGGDPGDRHPTARDPAAPPGGPDTGERQSPHAAGDGHPLPELVRTASGSDPSRAFWSGLLIGTVLVVATVLLIVQNGPDTSVRWLMLSFTAPLWLLLLASAVSGACLGALGGVLWRHRRRRVRRRRTARQRLQEITEARPVPDPRDTGAEGAAAPR